SGTSLPSKSLNAPGAKYSTALPYSFVGPLTGTLYGTATPSIVRPSPSASSRSANVTSSSDTRRSLHERTEQRRLLPTIEHPRFLARQVWATDRRRQCLSPFERTRLHDAGRVDDDAPA